MAVSLLPRHTRLASLRVILFLGLACRALRRSHAPLFTGQCLDGSVDGDSRRLSRTQARGNQLPQPDVSDDGKLSRGDFLQGLAGVGTSAMAALSIAPQPANALFEDARKPGGCPRYEAVSNFDLEKYMGIWYELAYHDWTQIDICGCTRFNMTRSGGQIRDAFTTKCPYRADEAETYVMDMREEVNDETPGSFVEHAFYNTWRNKVVALWKSHDAQGNERYERAIQMQCVEVLGRRAFVGINFLSRVPIVTPAVLAEMFGKARMLGLASIGGNPAEMVVVPHAGCRYPGSTDRSLRKDKLSWGSGWGVNIITS